MNPSLGDDAWARNCSVLSVKCPRKPCDCTRRGACSSPHLPLTCIVHSGTSEDETDRAAPLQCSLQQLLDDSAKSGVQLAGSAAPMIVVLRLARSTAPGREDGDAQPNDEAVAETAGQDPAGLPVPLAYSVTLPCDGAVDLTSLSTDGFADPLYQPVALLEHSRPQRRMWNPRRECYEHQLGLMHNHCGRGQIFGIGCIPKESGFCILLAKAKANVMVRVHSHELFPVSFHLFCVYFFVTTARRSSIGESQ